MYHILSNQNGVSSERSEVIDQEIDDVIKQFLVGHALYGQGIIECMLCTWYFP